jgi:uncharacterized membrane protein YcaP (DUF421 family)
MSAFEMLLLEVLGDLIQQGVTQEDMSFVGAALAVGTFAGLILTTSYLSYRFPRAAGVLDGLPVAVVWKGRVDRTAMRIERLTDAEIIEAARSRGIADLRTVRIAVLEGDGSFSFVTDGRGDIQPPERHEL